MCYFLHNRLRPTFRPDFFASLFLAGLQLPFQPRYTKSKSQPSRFRQALAQFLGIVEPPPVIWSAELVNPKIIPYQLTQRCTGTRQTNNYPLEEPT